MYPHGLCAPVYSKRAETLPLLLLLLLCVCVCVCVCHWLSELRHVRSHAHKEKKEKSPQSGTVYTPISQYTHTHNNIRRSSRTGGELREQVTSAQNGFLSSSSSSMSYQFLQFRRRKKSTFPFLLSLSLFAEHAPVVRGNRPTGEEEAVSSSLVAITQFSPSSLLFSFYMR